MAGFVLQQIGRPVHSRSCRDAKRPRRVATACASREIEDMTDEQVDEVMRRMNTTPDGQGEKYRLSTERGDPITDALHVICGCEKVLEYELLDSRWNGNETVKATTNRGNFFVKMNRVEDASVFMSEAVGLTTMIKTETLACPKPIHVGKLPKVGEFGPGAFMILEWLELVPFGASRPEVQKELGAKLAEMHQSKALDGVHKGRFGFVVNNYLALTPMDNNWTDDWSEFFGRRIRLLIKSLFEPKIYARAPFRQNDENSELVNMGNQVIRDLPEHMAGAEIRPALLHGDLWIGNAGATKDTAYVYDPACFFGHHEMDLAIMKLFGGFTDDFFDAYHERMSKADGFERRAEVYKLYHYLNQLNLFGNEDVKQEVLRLLRALTR